MGLLHDAKLDKFYEQDVHGLNGLLDELTQRGMPVDPVKRLVAAQALEQERQQVLAELQALIPDEVKPKKVYKKQPKMVPVEHLRCDDVLIEQPVCAYCGARKPVKRHSCWKAQEPKTEIQMAPEPRWARTLPFVISPKGILKYLRFRSYPVPSYRDRETGQMKETTDENALRRLALKHETDAVFPKILKFREVQKQLGTYVGYPE